jgi:hypothetical protein
MKRQSEAVGSAPLLTGWPQSPSAATAVVGPASGALSVIVAMSERKAFGIGRTFACMCARETPCPA